MPLPLEIVASHPIMEPFQILQHKIGTRDGQQVKQILVEQKDISLSSTTWEDADTFAPAYPYPEFNLEDKVEVEGGISMSIDQDNVTSKQSGHFYS